MTRRASAQIAIIGMSCIFPGARDLASFWQNIVNGKSSITATPESQWRNSDDKNLPYCKQGGFITDFTDFDPLKYGIMPKGVEGGDPDQFLALKVAVDALADAGYSQREFNKDKAEVILGRTSAPGAGALNFIQQSQTVEQVMSVVAQLNPNQSQEELNQLETALRASLKPKGADIIPALMPNIMAGRIANRLGFRGRTLVLDSACSSSITAVEMGFADLIAGDCDLALAGGIHTNSNKFFYDLFCGLGALSRSEQIRTFDKDADGTILGEGLGVVVLKRLEDAQRDGDRIYAVICGTGSSSDGNAVSILAPSIEGEALALQRAYDMAGFPANTVELLEAHGTGTIEGDVVELKAIEKVFGQAEAPFCAIGSIKTMIGHTQAASGIAGIIKTALALYHRVLPPTLNVKEPNPKIDWSKSPCYINTEARPWIHPEFRGKRPYPRRAAVSAFGFGGTNAHLVMEEPTNDETSATTLLDTWDSEVCLFQAETQVILNQELTAVVQFISTNPNAKLKDIAFTLSKNNQSAKPGHQRLAIVATSVSDLKAKAEMVLAGSAITNSNDLGIYKGCGNNIGKLAFIMPGLGAAYPNMLADLCFHFPEVREVFDFIEHLVLSIGDKAKPSTTIFPYQFKNGKKQFVNAATLAMMDSAVVVVLMAEWAIFTVLSNLGIKPDAVLGCSTGEFAALTMSGAADVEQSSESFYKHAVAVARSVSLEGLADLRSIRVTDNYDKVEPLLNSLKGQAYLSADLSPKQHLISGSTNAIDQLTAQLKANNIEFHALPVAIPYHTPLVEEAVTKGTYDEKYSTPQIPAWSCSQIAPYPNEPEKISQFAKQLFRLPIQFRKTIEAMYQQGITTFIEVGPKNTLTELVAETLVNKPHNAIATNLPNKSGISQINHAVASLFSNGLPVDLNFFFKRRQPVELSWQSSPPASSKTTMKLDLSYPEVTLPPTYPPFTHGSSYEQPDPAYASNRTPQEFAPDNMGIPNQSNLAGDDLIIANYLSSMEQFHNQLLQAQQQVMTAFLQNPEQQQYNEAFVQQSFDPSQLSAYLQPAHLHHQHHLPCLPNAEIELMEHQVTVRRVLNLETDLYLLDHAIGGTTATGATFSGHPERVFLVPLMVALEIMAETAALLSPQFVISKLENIRAYRRIRVDRFGQPITVVARLQQGSDSVIEVEISDPTTAQPFMSCHVVFNRTRMPQPIAQPVNMQGERGANLSKPDLYTEKAMFHGPRMQSVEQIDSVSHRAIKGTVNVRQPLGWFPQLEPPQFLVDPLLLDNSSQLVLFHLYEQDENVTALLPFHINSIEFFSAPNEMPAQVNVQAQLISLTDKGTEARLDIISNGKVLVRVNDITSKRVMLTDKVKDFVNDPENVCLSQPYTQFSNQDFVFMSLPAESLPKDTGTIEWLTDYLLTRQEREYFLKDTKLEKRKREWLAGRIAAKDAVRQLIQKLHNIKLCPQDIEISYSAKGQPIVTFLSPLAQNRQVNISIAHAEGSAIATAGIKQCGVDLEPIRDRGPAFVDMAFTTAEQVLFSNDNRLEIITLMWCAKEAVAKVIGQGMAGEPRNFEVTNLDTSTGVISVKSAEFGSYDVSTRVVDDVVVAFANLPVHTENLR